MSRTTNSTNQHAPQLPQLRQEFPGWSIWVSDGGHFYATRRGDLSERALERGLFMTVDGADLSALCGELQVQAEREERVVAVLRSLT